MIKLHRLYHSTVPDKDYSFRYDLNNKKRPSWLEFNDMSKNVQFVKITINEESFWYRRYFENYFFPLVSDSRDYENYYDEIAENYNKMVPQNKKIAEFILNFLRKYDIPSETEIIDLGAGTGIVAVELVKNGYNNIVLVDISEECLNVAKKLKELDNCKFIKGDMNEDFGYNDNKVIICSMSLYYNSEKELDNILKKIKSKLAERGWFICIDRHLPNSFNINFKEVESGEFFLDTPTGNFKYFYFIGQNDKGI
mgnify:CR=1 FL=1